MVPDTSTNSPCYQFELINDFYSPGYPQPYPNNTECIRVLEGWYIEEYFNFKRFSNLLQENKVNTRVSV